MHVKECFNLAENLILNYHRLGINSTINIQSKSMIFVTGEILMPDSFLSIGHGDTINHANDQLMLPNRGMFIRSYPF
jgi:hypothetical protein